jgi:hypothetical protein
VSVRRVDTSALAFSLSSNRHSYISLIFSSRFITKLQTTTVDYEHSCTFEAGELKNELTSCAA